MANWFSGSGMSQIGKGPAEGREEALRLEWRHEEPLEVHHHGCVGWRIDSVVPIAEVGLILKTMREL
jgi:hypothetical protein